MNRSARRRAQRKENKVVYTEANSLHVPSRYKHVRDNLLKITAAKLNEEAEEISRIAMNKAVIDMTSAFVLGIRRTEKFGKKRIQRLLDEVNGIFNAIRDNKLSLEEVKKECEDLGIPYNTFNTEYNS